MPVLNALSRVATGYNPDRRFLQSAGTLSNVIGNIGSQQKMQKFGAEILQVIESGGDVTGDDLMKLSQKYKLSPEETEQAFSLLQNSKALDAAIRKRKQAETPIEGLLAPGTSPFAAGTTMEQGGMLSKIIAPMMRAQGEAPEQWERQEGPGGSVLRRSTTTGKVEKVLGREPIEKPKPYKPMTRKQMLDDARERAKIKAGTKGPSITEGRVTAQQIAKTEDVILQGMENKTNVPHADFFNQYAKKPYVYLWKEGIETHWYGDKDTSAIERVDLPVVNGKQVLATDVWHTAKQNGVTIMEVLKRIGVSGK